MSSINLIICCRQRWTNGLSAVMKFSFTLNSTKLATFWVHFVTSFSVRSAVGLGGSVERKEKREKEREREREEGGVGGESSD